MVIVTRNSLVECNVCAKKLGVEFGGAPLLKCSKCLEATYCGRDCQVANWPSHRKACAAAVKTAAMREERALARPDLGATEHDVKFFADDITSEVTLLAMRSAFKIGEKDQCSTSRVLRLWFDYDAGAPHLRARFTFARSELVSFEEGLSHLSPATNAQHAGLVASTRLTRAHKEPDYAMGTIVFMMVNKKTGRCWPYMETQMCVRNSAWEFLSAQEMSLNPNWERTFAVALSHPELPGPALLILELFSSEAEERAKEAVWRGLSMMPSSRPRMLREMVKFSGLIAEPDIKEKALRALKELQTRK
ncbi:hypothetical protein BCR35DRAFT_309553 [Leucosporidium creatinivorum]|uniref:MYND-type domain-containing protein n=1 Tax=Leucosporidium creatinivorum TaxID=106004 RepID=A0A1Y2DFH5_9BASI|nr:hypothetical protein BCR35DRAFT_309553 [Leucosporidium creatinivorum]